MELQFLTISTAAAWNANEKFHQIKCHNNSKNKTCEQQNLSCSSAMFTMKKYSLHFFFALKYANKINVHSGNYFTSEKFKSCGMDIAKCTYIYNSYGRK